MRISRSEYWKRLLCDAVFFCRNFGAYYVPWKHKGRLKPWHSSPSVSALDGSEWSILGSFPFIPLKQPRWTPEPIWTRLEIIIFTKTGTRTPDLTAHGLVTAPHTPPWPHLTVGVELCMKKWCITRPVWYPMITSGFVNIAYLLNHPLCGRYKQDLRGWGVFFCGWSACAAMTRYKYGDTCMSQLQS